MNLLNQEATGLVKGEGGLRALHLICGQNQRRYRWSCGLAFPKFSLPLGASLRAPTVCSLSQMLSSPCPD